MCSSQRVSYKSSLPLKALAQSSLLLPVGTARLQPTALFSGKMRAAAQ